LNRPNPYRLQRFTPRHRTPSPPPPAPIEVPTWWPDELNAWRSELEIEGFPIVFTSTAP
jgi:hypothetical protein